MHSAIEVGGTAGRNAPTPDVDWHRWCRLCAKADAQNTNVFLKDENTSTEGIEALNQTGLPIAISKYFNIEIKKEEQLPVQLCTECFTLVSSLIKFNERVAKVQQMYQTLQHFHDNRAIDIQAMRLKYGVLEDDRPHDFMYRYALDIQLFEENKEHENKSFFSGEAVTEITLPEPRTCIDEIKKENSNDTAALSDEDVCDFDNEDVEADDPFGSDVELNKNDRDDLREEGANTKNYSSEIETNNESNSPHLSVKGKRGFTKKNENNTSRDYSMKKEKTSFRKTTIDGSAGDGQDDEKEDPYTCVECSKIFKRFSFYRSHMERKHAKADTVPRFACTECPLTFNTPTQLNHHHTIKHLTITERRIVPCPYCGQKFPTKTNVAQHIKFVHMNERSFICEECGEAVRSKGQLKQHMLTHTDYAPFECEVCKKCFKNHERLKNHMETHNPNKHICAECGLQLNSRITLNRHLLVHSDVMQHKCDYCGRAFKRAKALKNHLILHTGLKPYSCDFCDRTFANGSNCRTHKRKAHPAELAAQEAAGEKTYTKNIPKLAVLKSVTQAAENLAPVVSKQSGNFAFGKKPKLPPDSVGTISRKQQRKLLNESILSAPSSAPTTLANNEQQIGGNGDNNTKQQPLQPASAQIIKTNQNGKDDNSTDARNIPSIDNIYSNLLKQQVAGYSIDTADTINPMHMEIKRSRSEESSPLATTGNNSSCTVDIDIKNSSMAQQHQLSQNIISSPSQQQQTTIPNVLQSFYRC